MTLDDRNQSRPAAFTLVELVVVLIVLAILAGVAAPVFFDHSFDARVARATYNRAALVTALHEHMLQQRFGTAAPVLPATLDDLMENTEGEEFFNPFAPPDLTPYHSDNSGNPNKFHSSYKTIEAAMATPWGCAIWYSPLNGSVGFKVPERPTTQATIDLYNTVNNCSITSLSQTTR